MHDDLVRRSQSPALAPRGRLPWPKPKLPLLIVRHVSPTPALPSRESPPIAWPALFNNRACRPCALATAASNACLSGSGMQVSRILARLSSNANRACWDRPSPITSRLYLLDTSDQSLLGSRQLFPVPGQFLLNGVADKRRRRRESTLLGRLVDAFVHSLQRSESLAVPYVGPHQIRKWRGPFGTAKIGEIDGRIPTGMRFAEMHPARSASAATRRQTKRAARIPTLMFHYAFLAVWEPSWRVATVTIRCTSITN